LYAQTPSVLVDGKLVQIPDYDQHPVIVNNRTLVPLRAVMEALGFVVEWNSQTQTATLVNPKYEVVVQIGRYDMLVNNNAVPLDVPAQIMGGRTMVPLRAISEATGMEVIWEGFNNIAHILTPITIDYWPEHLPPHVPGSVVLGGGGGSDIVASGLLGQIRYRYVFYGIGSNFTALVEPSEFTAWRTDVWSRSENEMMLMEFVRYFDIQREDFDAAVTRRREALAPLAESGLISFYDEEFELPNADIIFTFDQDIARYFYRRE